MRAGLLLLSGMAAALFGAGLGAPALAGPADDAERLVQEGIAFRSAFRDAEALEKFQRAYEIARTPRIQAQIGAAEQALGRWVDAETHITQALAASKDAWIVKNRPTLEIALAAVRTHLGSLEILGKPPGAEVRIEGEVLGRFPLPGPLKLPAGRTTLEVRAPGYFAVSRPVTIEAEKLTRETVNLRAEENAASPVTARVEVDQGGPAETKTELKPKGEGEAGASTHSPADNGGGTGSTGIGWRRPTEIVTASLAVVGLAFGIVEHLKWQDKTDAFGSMNICGANLPGRGGAGCDQLYSDGQSARTLTFVGYGAAAALGATAAILFFTEPGPGPDGRKVVCVPTTLARGVECALRF